MPSGVGAVVVLGLLVGAHAGQFKTNGPLMRSATSFASCRFGAGKDIDLNRFIEATRQFCEIIRKFGVFASPSIKNALGCVDKVEASCDALAKGDGPRRRWPRRRSLQSMRELLAAEVEAGMHGRGGILADPSAAMGLLWVRRGLAYWARVFELEAEKLAQLDDQQPQLEERSGGWLCFCRQRSIARDLEELPEETRESGRLRLKQESITAYEEVLKPFHGWVSRRGFGIALSGCPDWSDVRERAGFPLSNECLRAELRAWAAAIRKLQKCMLGIHEKLDLEDRRKSV